MSSTAVKHSNGNMKNMARMNQYPDFSSAVGRVAEDERTSGSSAALVQPYSASIWGTSPGAGNSIWASDNSARNNRSDGSRPPSELRKNSFPHLPEMQTPNGTNQSLHTTEEDYPYNPYSQYSELWNAADKSPPAASNSGTISPARHRGSISNGPSNTIRPAESQHTSPYLSRQAPHQGTGFQNLSNHTAESSSSRFTYSRPNLQSTQSGQSDLTNSYRGKSVVHLDSPRSNFIPRAHQANTNNIQSKSTFDAGLPPSRQAENNGYAVHNSTSYFNGRALSKNVEARPTMSSAIPSYSSYISNGHDDPRQALAMGVSSLNIDSRTPDAAYNHLVAHELRASRASNNVQNTYTSNGPARTNLQMNIMHPHLQEGRSTESASHTADARHYMHSEALPHQNRRAHLSEFSSDLSLNYAIPALQSYVSQSAHADLYGPQGYVNHYNPRNYQQQGQQAYANPGDQYAYAAANPYFPAMQSGRNLSRDVYQGLRSQILEDFRNNSRSNKAFTLKDVYGHIVEFSGDQHGSRWIQQKLETANSDEKERVFSEILENINQLTIDIFGNYVVQKLYERGDQVQKKMLAKQMRGHVSALSVHGYGCRVVQTALDHVLADQQVEIVQELREDILKCVKDQNGNHVVQKAIEKVPMKHIQFIIDAFKGQVYALATHNYGCRVMQRMLTHCDQPFLLEEIFACAPVLIVHEYGNYVIQHIIQHGKAEDRARIIAIVNQQLLTFCKSKFASNVVECAMAWSTNDQRRSIATTMMAQSADGTNTLQILMKDQFGNYVVQKLLLQLKGADWERLAEAIKPQISQLKRFNSGKQIAAIEKLVCSDSSVSDISAAATPLLTTTQNSPQSSNAPSCTGLPSTDDTDIGKFDSRVNVVNL